MTVDDLTDEPLTPMLRLRVLDYVAGLSRHKRRQLSFAIDATCVYTREGVALPDGRACPMHEWHALAAEILTDVS